MTLTRRDLIELGLAGTSATLAGAAIAAPSSPKQSGGERIGMAVVGLGKLSLGQIIPALRTTTGVRLAAVVSGDPAKARRVAAENALPGDAIYSYDTFDRIAGDPRIGIVYICCPTSFTRNIRSGAEGGQACVVQEADGDDGGRRRGDDQRGEGGRPAPDDRLSLPL